MVYSTSRCPTCGKVVKQQRNPIQEIGCPFERCPYCGNVYLNSYKQEWCTKSPLKRLLFFIQGGDLAVAFFGGAIPLIFCALFELSAFVICVFLWPVFSVALLIIRYAKNKKESQQDIADSLARTRDNEYVNLLRKAGYTIYPVEK